MVFYCIRPLLSQSTINRIMRQWKTADEDYWLVHCPYWSFVLKLPTEFSALTIEHEPKFQSPAEGLFPLFLERMQADT